MIKQIRALSVFLVLLLSTAFVAANEVTVSTPDGDVVLWESDVVSTSQYKARNGLASAVAQARLYVTEADGTEHVRSVDVNSLDEVTFQPVSLPPTVGIQHSLVLQLLGEEFEDSRQTTFSSIPIYFDIEPNKTTLVEGIILYLTKLTVKSEFTNAFLTPGALYQLETTTGDLELVIMDSEETTFTLTYDAGERPQTLYDEEGSKIGDIEDNTAFGAISTEELDFDLNDGNVQAVATLVSTDSLLSSPGLLVDDLPNAEVRYYNIEIPLDAGDYAIFLTVGGETVSYPVVVGIDEVEVSSTIGAENLHSIANDGDVMSLVIDFEEYDYLVGDEVRLYVVESGELD
jgi:hypothetical protein